MSEGRLISKTYHHLGNSGLTIKIEDNGWAPQLVIENSAFGNLKQRLNIHASEKSLRAIAHQLLDAAENESFDNEYTHSVDYEKTGSDRLGVSLKKRLRENNIIPTLNEELKSTFEEQNVGNEVPEDFKTDQLAEEVKKKLSDEEIEMFIEKLQ
jgi:hypothetical protein